MRCIKAVFVPRWLDRVAKEVGISNDDLISIEKLSCILSKRDLELYQMANFNMAECIGNLSGENEKDVANLLGAMVSPFDILPLEKRAAYANVDVETFIYGASATRNGEGEGVKYTLCVDIADQDTVLIRVGLCDSRDVSAPSFAKCLAEKIHAMMDFCSFVNTGAFKQYVRELQIN